MNYNIQSSQVMFFLGAGASVAADVPDTFSFVKEFRDSIGDTAKKETIEKTIQTLESWKRLEIDIELLLETLTKLETKEQEPLLKFFEGGKFILSGYSPKKPLIEDLKDFIKSKAIVSEEKIKYLQPILGFVEEFRPLDVISVNYDTCVEQFCNVHKLIHQDGFDVNWNPKTFATEHTDVRLYKLHGSVMWYQSDRGGYIKLPVMTRKSKIELITGEKAENLMLYPMQKWDYAEPLLELLVEIKHRLESETCKFLIVVGYSFRDDHIRRILWDAARKNRELHCILIDPKAYQIYSSKLKYYDVQHKTPSSLDGRVVCLPYKFEKVFPYLKNHYLKNLRDGLNTETAQHQAEIIRGEKANWISCIPYFVNAEHCEKVECLIEQVNNLELEGNWQMSLELSLKMFVNLSANNREEVASLYFKKFSDFLRMILVERIEVNVLRGSKFAEIYFNYIRHDSGASYIKADQFKEFIEKLSEFCEKRIEWVREASDELRWVTETLKSLNTYLEPFEEETMGCEAYINTRTKQIADVEGFRNKYQKKEYPKELQNELRSEIENIERRILNEILGRE